MSTAHSTTPTAADLTPAELAEARALRDELLSTRDASRPMGEGCGRQALATVRDLLAFAADWDAMALAAADEAASVADLLARAEAGQLATLDALAAEQPARPAPALDPRHARAAAKAAYYLAAGLTIRYAPDGAALVPSGTRGGTVHRVAEGVCSCEAGQAGKACWHVEAVAQVEAGAFAPLAA